jgi:capsular polysaccharide biosynthesis protein
VSDGNDLKTLGDALRHRGMLLLAIVVAFLLGATALVLLMPRTYEGRAQLLVDVRWNVPQDFDVAVLASEHLTRYFLLQTTSRPVLERAIGALALTETPEHLVKRVQAKAVKGTSLIEVRAQARTPQAAAALTNAVAAAAVEQNQRDVPSRLAATRKYLDGELSRLDTAMQELERQVVPPNNPAAISARQAQLAGLQSQYDHTYARSQDLALAQARGLDMISVAERAQLPKRPLRPDALTYLAAALLVGLLVGVLAVLLLERFDDRLFSAEKLALATGTSLVINVPHRSSPSSVAQPNPYVLARANLRARYPNAHIVLMAGASPRDDAGHVATELGSVAADEGDRVLVLQSSGVAGAPDSRLDGSGPTRMAVDSEKELYRFLADLKQGARRFDVVLLSMPSPERSPMAVGAVQASDFGILVATAGRTRYADAQRTAETLRSAGLELAASVLLAEPRRNGSRAEPER